MRQFEVTTGLSYSVTVRAHNVKVTPSGCLIFITDDKITDAFQTWFRCEET